MCSSSKGLDMTNEHICQNATEASILKSCILDYFYILNKNKE